MVSGDGDGDGYLEVHTEGCLGVQEARSGYRRQAVGIWRRLLVS